jgi:hypothetical protein
VHESALYEQWVCVYVCEWLFVETVCLLGVDVRGGPVVSENGREDVKP